ncbi:MAG: carboxypeptidase-like regulatory domain-containing protein [Lewinellaceae bacterium]|nr:carboxypeptidase-like regulatory domain-containing protein [Lewinellaceae bacterium]
MKFYCNLITAVLLCSPTVFLAQSLTQTVRGVVIDADTREALVGASVFIPGSDPLIGTTTDENGQYILTGVPLGRQALQCTYVGYLSFLRDNIQISSGKEYVLDIALKAGVEAEEVVISAYRRNEAVNELAVVSVRRLDPEELQYHAATANDPSRLVLGFPGVQPSRDSRSDIVIRGNSSLGILWRLEGIDIPNPNHFARRGSSGGGITVFSASLLGSSDFSVGAFPAEYGNAFAGVFDMRFRNGNLYQREHTFRAGLLGLDLATEGPIKEGKSSYLANFRYSTLGILNAAGLHLVGPRTDNNFQDFSFKLYSKGKKSQLSLWGIGGNSREIFNPEEEMPWQSYSDYAAYEFTTRMGAVGVSWNYLLNDRSFIQVNAGVMGQQIYFRDDTLNVQEQPFAINEEDYRTNQVTLNAYYKRTFSPQWNMKIGVIGTVMNYSLQQARWMVDQQTYRTVIDGDSKNGPGNNQGDLPVLSGLQQQYIQFSFRPSQRWVFNFGSHFLQTSIGDVRASLEPRVALQYRLNARSSLALAYGLHSRMPPLGSYFVRTENNYPNLGLDLIKANHLVLAYNQAIGENLNLHAETYYQTLSQVPVGINANRIYWSLNDVQGFAGEALVSEGTGRNLGVDLTLEKFFHQGTFFVLSTSVFSSTFQVPGKDGRFSTQYDGRFSLSFTSGKTWTLNEKTFLEGGFRLLFNAGNPITPLALGFETQDGEDPVLNDQEPFSQRVKGYLRPDLRLALRRNQGQSSYWLALDVQNLINRANEDFLAYEFDVDAGRWGPRRQSTLTPLLTFQIDF